MGFEEVITGTIGFAMAMAMMGLVIGGVLYGYYQYVQSQVLANYLWPVIDVVPPYKGGYYMAVINTGHEPFFVKAIFLSGGGHLDVKSKVLYRNDAWFYEVSELPSAVMVCSAIKPSVCVIAKASGWALINDAPPGSGWVNVTFIVDPWAVGGLAWVGVGGGNKGVSGYIGLNEWGGAYFSGYATKDIFTYGPIIIEVTYSYSVPQMSCSLEVSPNVQPILISSNISPYSTPWTFTYILIATPNTDLTIHVKCTYAQGYW